MLFITLFILSILALVILVTVLKKNESKKLLHYIEKSCNIDSVRFEKRSLYLFYFIRKQVRALLRQSEKLFYKLTHHKEKTLHTIKRSVRKKLFVQGHKQNVSEFISKLK